MINKEEFITRAKEILEMKLEAENLRKTLGQDYDNYFVEKATTALKWLKNEEEGCKEECGPCQNGDHKNCDLTECDCQ